MSDNSLEFESKRLNNMTRKKKPNVFLLLITVFSLTSMSSKADILEKYLKQDNKNEVKSVEIAPTDKELIKAETIKKKEANRPIPASQRVFTQRALGIDSDGSESRNVLFNFSFGANREHLKNRIYFSSKTSAIKKFSPSLGLELNYDEQNKRFSNIAFFLGIKYVLLKYKDLEFTLGYDQELENMFTIEGEKDIYTFLTSRIETKLSYEITSNFIIFTSFSPKYSFVSETYLESAPEGLKKEAKQIIDYHYGVLVSL